MFRLALGILVALTVLRLVVAATVPLVPDEAYYWVWSRALAPGYPDHPPMVALWIRIGTLIAGDNALGIRLLGPLSVAAMSLLLADAAERLMPARRAGLHAAGLLNATLLIGAGGVLMTPDIPLLAFWTATLWALARLIDGGDERWWLAVGLFAGLALTSKYTAVLLWAGIALWLLLTPTMRPWLRRPMPWLGAAIGAAIFAPVLAWDIAHDWTSIARQGGRLGNWQPERAIQFLAELIGGQAGLSTPLVFVLCVAGVVAATRDAWRTRQPAPSLLSALTVPAAVLFTQHAIGDRVQGNWPGIIYPAAVIAAAGLRAPVWQRLWAPGVALGFALTFLIYLQAAYPWLPARYDPTARYLGGWDTLAAEVDAVRRRTGAQYIAVDQYGVAAELARALPSEAVVLGAEERWAHFRLPEAQIAGRSGLLLRSRGRREPPDPGVWPQAVRVATVGRRRGVTTIELFQVHRVEAAQDTPAVVVLPRPR